MSDFDTEFASFRGQKPQADGATFDDEFSAFRQTKSREQAALRSSVDAAMQTTPEQAAKVKYLSNVTGIDLSVIATQEGEVKARAKLQEIQKEAQFSPILQSRLRDPEFTKLAIDDVPTLSKLEQGIGSVMQFVMGADGKGGLPGMVGRGAQKAYYGSVSGTSGAFRAASEFVAPVLDPIENVQSIGGNPLRRLAEGFGLIAQGANANSDAIKSPYDGNIAAGAESGFTSLGQNAKYLPLTLAGPAGVAAALVGMSLETGGQSYQKAREKGVGQNLALAYGASDAVIEFATEKIPMHRLIGDVAANTNVFKTVAKQIGLEVPGEQIATALQDLNEWAVMNPEKTFGDYIAARPDAAIQTLVATVIGTGGNVAVSKALGTLMDAQTQKEYNDLFNAQRDAQERAAKLQDVMATAAGSKLRELSPETFREHVQAAADGQDGAPKSVHIDGQVLLQTLQSAGITEEQLAQSMPSVVSQLADAAVANSTVEIPIGELATALPGTPLEQAILPHLRIGGPDSLSQAEAEQAQEQAQEYLKGESERVMQESQDQAQWAQESEGVKTTIREQLSATGRFSDDVNSKYATLVRDFYSVMASRTGMTPKALYDLMPYKVGSKVQSGAVLDTAPKSEAIGDKLMARVENEFPALVEEYKALPETNGGQVINTDMARELSPEYRADRTRSAEVHDAASTLMTKLYAERLAQPVQEGRAPTVLFTAGGTGAGKSSGLEMMPELAAQSDIIYDGTMSKLKGAVEKIEQALAAGRDVQYMYVYREPGEALQNGALPRAMKSGRTAPLQVLQDSHTGARAVAEALAEKYKDNPRVSFIFIDNSQGRGNAKVVALANIPQVPDNGLKEKLNAILDQEYQAGNISDAVYTGTKEPVSTMARSAGNDSGRVQSEAGSAVRGQFEQGGSGELNQGDQTPNKYQAKYLAGRDLASLNAEERAQYDVLATQVTDTPEFKNWFGDWADPLAFSSKRDKGKTPVSQAVNKDGTPRVMYHSTNGNFDTFQPGRSTTNETTFGPMDTERHGIFVTPDVGFSEEYLRGREGANVMPVYIDVKFPADLTDGIPGDVITDIVENSDLTRADFYGIQRGNEWEIFDGDFGKKVVEALKAAGYDGATLTELDRERENEHETWVAFSPTQIKSATGNNGQFDPNNPSILAQPQAQGPRGTFNPSTLTTVLNENADLSTFLHETGHFFLEAMATLASQPNADLGVVKDMNALLKWFGVPDLATWQGYTLEQQRKHHERFAESFEQYLLEGKAPNTELASLFRTFRAWLTRVYRSLKEFSAGRDLQLSDDIRQVMDRMVASEEQIAEAEKVAGLVPNLDATGEAIEQLQSRSIRDLKWAVNARNKFIKQMQQDAKAKRKEVEAEVTAEVDAMPEFAAKKALDDLRKATKEKPSDSDLAAIADAHGFNDYESMLSAIEAVGKKADVIEGMTDQRMLERYGDLVDQGSIEQAATEAVHNAARAKSLATELAAQRELLNPRQDTGKTNAKGQRVTVNALAEAAKQFAANVIGRKAVSDLKKAAYNHLQAERRAAKAWEAATAKGDTKAAVQAKQDQMLNNAAVRAANEAQADVKKTMEFFAKVMKGNSESVVEKGRDADIVNAARAILAVYGVGAFKGKNAFEYMDLLKANDPNLFAILDDSVRAAVASAKPVGKMTVDELTALKDEIASMWHLAKSSRQYEVDGDRMDIEDAAEELKVRMEAKGVPATMPGDFGAVTEAEKRGRSLQFAGALLRRVESWAEAMDGKFGGPFLKLVFQPVKAAADRYRADRAAYRKQFTKLAENVSPALKPGTIEAPELGYTFGKGKGGVGQAELLSAILHLGNESNKRKLLLGRNWATENEDGSLDTSRWDSFMERMHNTGVINKAHYDFAQGVWDLLEKMKPLAQKTHRDVYGRYFAEVTSNAFEVPGIGYYRGGYVPAQVDPEIVKDNEMRKLAEVENENMSYAFPATNKGFTKSRTEYNRPLMLDLRTLPQHIDKVLLFSHMEPAVRGVSKVLQQKGVGSMLSKIDPAAISGMLTPWLNRSARQIVETPIVGDGRISRVLSVVRARAGMSVMFANLSNTVQQLAGLTLARVKIERGYLLPAMAQYTRNPKKMSEAVAAASSFMATRMDDQVAALNGTVEEILLNPSVYEKAKNWTAKHTYFLQSALDNVVGPVVWSAAYNQALTKGMREKDAVHFADGTVRQTQGSTLPEDVSRIETGPSYARIFTQFIGYFNMVANTNVTALQNIADDVGLKKGAGKALAIVFFGLLAPAWIAEAIAQGFKGGPDDEDKDGSYLDDWLKAVFGLGTVKTLLAGVPFVGQFAMAGLNTWNGKPYDDRTSLSPAVSMLEGAVGAPHSVYKALVENGSKQKAVRDVATAISMMTGLPVSAAARPLGYLTGVAENKINPTGPMDAARGVVTGTASPESKR